jgi:hypothetical protein
MDGITGTALFRVGSATPCNTSYSSIDYMYNIMHQPKR